MQDLSYQLINILNDVHFKIDNSEFNLVELNELRWCIDDVVSKMLYRKERERIRDVIKCSELEFWDIVTITQLVKKDLMDACKNGDQDKVELLNNLKEKLKREVKNFKINY
jgi:hypothetical protein